MHFMIGLAIFVVLMGLFPRIMWTLMLLAAAAIAITIGGSVPHH
jgi:hypothetical protein